MIDLDSIKYFQDKFFLRLNGFDLENLNTFADDATFSQQQAIYMHEYYHYLTNLTTFYGARQFNCRFQDRVRLITILLKKRGLDAFPLEKNNFLDCKYEVEYWKSLTDLFELDDVNNDIAEKVDISPNHKFTIVGHTPMTWPLSVQVNGQTVNGGHIYYKIDINDVPFVQHFYLSDGMIDEFLSGAIDEFMFEHDLADNCEVLRAQTFYPYRTLDALLEYFNIERMDAREKILISYFALHATNPIYALILLLESMQKDHGMAFKADAEGFLRGCLNGNEINAYVALVNYEATYIDECLSHGRKNLADTMTLIYKKQNVAVDRMRQDFFYYIRPFMVDNFDTDNGRAEMLRLFKNIRIEMDEPVIIQDGKMIAADSDTYKNHLAMQIAVYEIMDSLWINRIATRLTDRKRKYDYPVSSPDNDKFENLVDSLPLTQTWHVALNELGLYGEYLKEKKTQYGTLQS